MAEVTLEILQPNQTDMAFTGSASAVRLQGQVVHSPIPASALFFKWYSSLAGELIQHDGPSSAIYGPPQFAETLKVGTHAISYTCKDQKLDTDVALQAVQHAGMDGGAPPDASNPRLVTILIANMLAPSNGASVSRAAPQLIAEAPSAWDDNEGYQTYNKVAYEWRFSKSGTTSVIDGSSMTFAKAAEDGSNVEKTNRLIYSQSLTSQLTAGTYSLILRVYYRDNSNLRHDSAAISITLT